MRFRRLLQVRLRVPLRRFKAAFGVCLCGHEPSRVYFYAGVCLCGHEPFRVCFYVRICLRGKFRAADFVLGAFIRKFVSRAGKTACAGRFSRRFLAPRNASVHGKPFTYLLSARTGLLV